MPSLDAIRAAAVEQAATLESDFIGTEHLFLAWLTHARGPIIDAMSAAGLTADSFAVVLSKGSRKGRGGRGAPMGGQSGSLTSHAQRVVEQAIERARTAGRDEPSADDLVLAMIQEPRGAIARALTEFDLKPSRLKALAAGRPAGGRSSTPRAPAPTADSPAETPAPQPSREKPLRREREPRAEREPRTGREARPEREVRQEREPRPERQASRVTEVAPVAPLPLDEADLPPRRAPPLDVERGNGLRWTTPLYLAIPIAIWLYVSHANPLWILIAACVGVLPLAGLMGEATEQLAERTGPTLGGLLNATFGNAAELIIAIAALRAGLVDLVKASIAGSILGNLLLILGLALMAGGSRAAMLRFNRTNAGMSSAMLALAVAGLIFPTLFHITHPEGAAIAELQMSEVVAGILIVTYIGSLWFVLRTHRPLFGGGAMKGHDLTGTWSVPKAIGLLTLATVGVAVMSEILVHAVEPVSASFGVSQTFLGLILIPVIGNAAEHGTAVIAARRGHTDLALQIALGSSTQIALLIAPVLVFVGVIMAVPGMNLVFSPFEVIGLSIAVVTSAIITLDGESHWFEGLQLLALYAMLGAAAWFI